MNFLKNMEVTGQIRSAYAALTVRYDFVNPGGESVSPRYYFPLPEGAVITDMQLLTGAKALLRSEIVTAASSIYRDCGYCLTRLKSGIYVLSWEGLAPGESCTVVLSYLLRLPQNKDVCTLVLPFGLWLPLLHPVEQNVCPMTVSLTLDGVESRAPYRADRQLEFSEHAQRDIVLEFEVKNPGSVGYVWDEMRGGMGYFRLFSHDRQRYQRWDKDKVQFILDLSGGMELKTVQRVKKLFYDLFLLLPKDTPAELWATGADMPCIPTEELMTFAWLQAQKTGGSLHDTLERALAAQSAKTLSVLVSGASILYPEQVLDGISPVCPLHLLSRAPGTFRRWVHTGKLRSRDGMSGLPKRGKKILRICLHPFIMTAPTRRFVPATGRCMSFLWQRGQALPQTGTGISLLPIPAMCRSSLRFFAAVRRQKARIAKTRYTRPFRRPGSFMRRKRAGRSKSCCKKPGVLRCGQ